MVVLTSKVPISVVPSVEASFEPYIPSSEPLALVPQEPAVIAEVPPLVVATNIAIVRDRATALKVVRYDKENFDQFKEETLAQHQSLMRSYDKKKPTLLSYQANLKKEDLAYFTEIKAAKEERERLDIYIHQLKVKQEQRRVEARSKFQDLEKLNSEVALISKMSNQVT
ncbi:hypothetical protein AMTR_s00134p00095050 [Amborella trichopoda]|uniref:Uncharacterized protein n=1 Tax=Amborella trichopoda TaxID=13333 RepID=W1NZD2_AMBTC|nr:hypothetical protein AMTR_s00134p00095050 [Amborella trichopoda]